MKDDVTMPEWEFSILTGLMLKQSEFSDILTPRRPTIAQLLGSTLPYIPDAVQQCSQCGQQVCRCNPTWETL